MKEFKIRNGFLPETKIVLPEANWQKKVWLLLEHPGSSYPARVIGVISILIILLSIVNFCLESVS